MKTSEILIVLGVVGLAVGLGWLLHPAWTVIVIGFGLIVLGVALELAPEAEPYERPEGVDALITTTGTES